MTSSAALVIKIVDYASTADSNDTDERDASNDDRNILPDSETSRNAPVDTCRQQICSYVTLRCGYGKPNNELFVVGVD